nr:hypothetical protein [Mycoplasmopsis bovis]
MKANLDSEALVNALTGFFLLPPYELFSIYSLPNAVLQFEALKSTFVLMTGLIQKFIKNLKKGNPDKLSNVYNALSDNDLFKTSMEQIKEHPELEKQFKFEVERILQMIWRVLATWLYIWRGYEANFKIDWTKSKWSWQEGLKKR